MRRVVLLALALGIALLAGCRSAPLDSSQRAKIVGGWYNPNSGAQLTIHADGEFILLSGGREIRGRMNRGGDRVAINYMVPTTLCQGISGLYRFERLGNQLNFDLISDTCDQRPAQILQMWVAEEQNLSVLADAGPVLTPAEASGSVAPPPAETESRPRGKGKPGQRPFIDLTK